VASKFCPQNFDVEVSLTPRTLKDLRPRSIEVVEATTSMPRPLARMVPPEIMRPPNGLEDEE
jgi:hypothetical protein